MHDTIGAFKIEEDITWRGSRHGKASITPLGGHPYRAESTRQDSQSYRWTGEEEDSIYLFPYTGDSNHHRRALAPLTWNRVDLSKLLVRFDHVVDVDERTLDKADLRAARVTVRCDKIAPIPRSSTPYLAYNSVGWRSGSNQQSKCQWIRRSRSERASMKFTARGSGKIRPAPKIWVAFDNVS